MRQRPFLLLAAGLSATLSLTLGLGACANMAMPEGGPYDITPPHLVQAVPENLSTQFHGRRIRLRFDENIRLEKQDEQVMISPPQKEQAKIAAIGHVLTVNLQDSLQANTTYVIDFNDAVVDENEGNPAGGFVFVFSTGSKIDSMQLSGRLIDARTLAPVAGVTVGAYPVIDDSTFLKKSFPRASLTNAGGEFALRFIPDSSYHVFALKDLDRNYYYSQITEGVAFSDSTYRPVAIHIIGDRPKTSADTVAPLDSLLSNLPAGQKMPADSGQELQKTTSRGSLPLSMTSANIHSVDSARADSVMRAKSFDRILLRYFVAINRKQYVKDTKRINKYTFNIEFGLPLDTLPRIALLDSSSPSAEGKPLFLLSGVLRGHASDSSSRSAFAPLLVKTAPGSLTCFLNDESVASTDTLKLTLSYPSRDARNRPALHCDTVCLAAPVALPAKDSDKKKSEARSSPHDSYTPRVSTSTGIYAGSPNDSIHVDFPAPVLSSSALQALKVEVLADTLWKAYDLAHVVQDSVNCLRYSFTGPWRYNTQYKLVLDSAALSDVYGRPFDKVDKTLSIGKEEDFGELELKLVPADSLYVLELLDENDRVVDTRQPVNGRVYFPCLKPGSYYARLFIDADRNGSWDTGEYPDKQPETVYYCPDSFTVKSKWQSSETWQVNSTPLTEQRPLAFRTKDKKDDAAVKRKELNEEYEKRMAKRKKRKAAPETREIRDNRP